MTAPRIYLDHNATTPLRDEARAAMLSALALPGNPSSVHAEGRRARAVVEEARAAVAQLVGARPGDVVFTSGGTEAVNTAVRAGYDVVVLAGIEHACVHEAVRAGATRCNTLDVTRDGLVTPDALDRALDTAGQGRVLVCLQLANNETGVIQPVAALAAQAKARGADVFVDAVQAVGRVPAEAAALGADALAISAHKLGGPKGVGALVLRPGFDCPAMMRGGGQERGRRGGTENVAGLAGFGAAAVAAGAELAHQSRVAAMRDRWEDAVLRATPGAVVFGREVSRLPNTSAVASPSVKAETMVIRMDLAGIAISAGSACSSGKVGRSATLAAMGVDEDVAGRVVRISLGFETTDAEIEALLAAWRLIHGRADAVVSDGGGAARATQTSGMMMGA